MYMNIKAEEYLDAFRTEIRTFADEDNYPIYFHCAIGRDRTGTLAMVLLGLLGVPEKMIIRDYEMSFLSKIASSDDVKPSDMIRVNLIPTMDYIKSFGGNSFMKSCENFLLSLGITRDEINAIRSIMLE